MIDLKLKGKTSLFEWVWSDTLDEINIIIQKLINNEPIIIKRIDNNNDYIDGTNIKTSHYIDKNYSEIVSRRSKRFLNDIMCNEILFIRDDNMDTIKIYGVISMIIRHSHISLVINLFSVGLSIVNLCKYFE